MLIFSFMATPVFSEYDCPYKIAAEAEQLIGVVARLTLLISEMEKYDEELDKAIVEMDKLVESTIMEAQSLADANSNMQKTNDGFRAIYNSQAASVLTKVNYLRESTLRLQYLMSKETSGDIKDFNNEK